MRFKNRLFQEQWCFSADLQAMDAMKAIARARPCEHGRAEGEE